MKTLIGFLLVLMGALSYMYGISSTFQKEILKQKEDFRSVYSGILNKTYTSYDHSSNECGSGTVFNVSNLYRRDLKQNVYVFFPKQSSIFDGGGLLIKEIMNYSDWITFYSAPLCLAKLKEDYPGRFDGFRITNDGLFSEKLYLGKTFYTATGTIATN